jgi:hypothetical protein
MLGSSRRREAVLCEGQYLLTSTGLPASFFLDALSSSDHTRTFLQTKLRQPNTIVGLAFAPSFSCRCLLVVALSPRLFRIPGPAPPVLADGVQLQQVIANLVTNAIEAMDAVDHHSRTHLLKSAIRKPYSVLIMVEDSVPGIDPENAERIFHPFFTTKSQGMGRGLSICRSIIEAHNGYLSARSAINRGSIFQISLPAWRYFECRLIAGPPVSPSTSPAESACPDKGAPAGRHRSIERLSGFVALSVTSSVIKQLTCARVGFAWHRHLNPPTLS